MMIKYLDSFQGADWILHFIIGFIISFSIVSILKSKNIGIGILSAFTIGLIKEIWDFNNCDKIMNGSAIDLFITLFGGLLAECIIFKFKKH